MALKIFLCGDVMPGRGIDQILPFPSAPAIHEPYVKDARRYVNLAEDVSSPIPRTVDFAYIWGDALDELKSASPDIRIINLETSITRSNDYWKNKGIHYRMNPDNIPSITIAGINCCCLANNHVLDWGYSGLIETLETLHKAGIKTAGAGRDLEEAEAPSVMVAEDKGKVILFSFGSVSSGIPPSWKAQPDRPGVNLLENLGKEAIRHIESLVSGVKRRGDITVLSVHWGGNWGYEIPPGQVQFAHLLIDRAGIDVVYGHSSHHVKGLEVYRDKLILYGCGNFLDDYEGIGGYEAYRPDLSLMYFPSLDSLTGRLISLQMTPMQIKRFRLNRAIVSDAIWLADTLNREGKRFGSQVELRDGNSILLSIQEK